MATLCSIGVVLLRSHYGQKWPILVVAPQPQALNIVGAPLRLRIACFVFSSRRLHLANAFVLKLLFGARGSNGVTVLDPEIDHC